MNKYSTYLLFVAVSIAHLGHGQYTHYSLYRFAESRVNPAYYATGKHATLNALYRNQQSTPGVKQTSTYLSARYPFLRRKSPWHAVGVEMGRDTEGLEGILETTMFGGAYGYHIPVNLLNSISLGVNANYFGRRINTESLFTGSQFMPGIGFDPSADNGEGTDQFRADVISVGLGLLWQKVDKKSNPRSHLGIAAYNANFPREAFITDTGTELFPIVIVEGAQRIHQGKQWSIDAEVNYRLEQAKSFVIAGATATLDLSRFNSQLKGQTIGYKARYLHNRGFAAGVVWDTPYFAMAANYDIPAFGTVAHQGAFEVALQLKKAVRAKSKRNKRTPVRRPVRPTRRPADEDDRLTILGDPPPDSVAVEESVPVDSLSEGEPINLDSIEVIIVEFEFEFGSAVPQIDDAVLQQVIDKLASDSTLNAEIVGHTDNVGSRGYNQGLSEERARALYDILLDMGVSEERMTYFGRGEMDPLMDNDTEENRAKNRRVEINFVSEE